MTSWGHFEHFQVCLPLMVILCCMSCLPPAGQSSSSGMRHLSSSDGSDDSFWRESRGSRVSYGQSGRWQRKTSSSPSKPADTGTCSAPLEHLSAITPWVVVVSRWELFEQDFPRTSLALPDLFRAFLAIESEVVLTAIGAFIAWQRIFLQSVSGQ